MGFKGVDFMWQIGVWKYQIVGHICGVIIVAAYYCPLCGILMKDTYWCSI